MRQTMNNLFNDLHEDILVCSGITSVRLTGCFTVGKWKYQLLF